MLSHVPITTGFDSRLTEKFFEPPASSDDNEFLSNIGKLRQAAAAYLFKSLIQSQVNDVHAQKLIVTHLLQLHSPILNFGPQPPIFKMDHAVIKKGLLPELKSQLTLEYILYYILERRIEYTFKMQNHKGDELAQLNKICDNLEYYGVDPHFKQPSPAKIQTYDDSKIEIYSELMISLMVRLSAYRYFNLSNYSERVSETAIAYKLDNCKTITLIYVIENDERFSLLDYAKREVKKNFDNLIDNTELFIELLTASSSQYRLSIILNSFSDAHLLKMIRGSGSLAALQCLLSETEWEALKPRFQNCQFFNVDPALTPLYFKPVTVPQDRGVSLDEALMRSRRSMLSGALVSAIKELPGSFNNKSIELTSEILSYFSDEFGIIKTKGVFEETFPNPSIFQMLDKFFLEKVPQVLSLGNVIHTLYTTKIMAPLKAILSTSMTTTPISPERKNEIEELLNYYGTDDNFSSECLFKDGLVVPTTDLEIERLVSLSLMHRLENHGFVDSTKIKKIIINQDTIYFFPEPAITLSFVNTESVPLTKYLLKQDIADLAQILKNNPSLAPALNHVTNDKLKSFYEANSWAILLCDDIDRFKVIVRDLSADELVEFSANIPNEYLNKLLTSADDYKKLIKLMPQLSLNASFFDKLNLEQFVKHHDTYDKFIALMIAIGDVGQEWFLQQLDNAYLQNIFLNSTVFLASAQLFYPSRMQTLCKKLGDKYLQCILEDADKFYSLIEAPTVVAYTIFNALSDEHLRLIFIDEDSLRVFAYAKFEPQDYMTKLINAGCGCSKTLLSDAASIKASEQDNKARAVAQVNLSDRNLFTRQSNGIQEKSEVVAGEEKSNLLPVLAGRRN